MKSDEVWKNFDLGTELSVAGNFIYNGLRSFHEMRTLDYAEEIFEFLYNLAAGLERLMKVAIVLLEHDGALDQEGFEKSLITHNHLQLLRRLRQQIDVNVGDAHIDLLNLLATFYKSFRYDRFSLSLDWQPEKEKRALRAFLEKHLGESFEYRAYATPNTPRFRKFIGKLVAKLSGQLYQVVETQARALNLYTYELRVDSKAAKIFLSQEHTFELEDVLWKELLVFFMNTKESSGVIEYLRSLDPLDFDPALAPDYLRCFQSEEAKRSVADELECLYDEMESPGDRLEALKPLGSPSIYWSESIEELEDGDAA